MANLKLSQLENLDIIDNETYIMVVKNGKNYKVSLNDAIEQHLNINGIPGTCYREGFSDDYNADFKSSF